MPRGRPKKVIVEAQQIANSSVLPESPKVLGVSQPQELKTVLVQESKQVVEEVKSDYNLEVIRDYYGNVDPTYLSKKHPDYEYRWLNCNASNITEKTGNLLFNKAGWQICPREHLLKIGIKEIELTPEGTYRRNELILAFMPKKLYQEKEAYKKRQADAPMQMIERLLKKGNRDVGGNIHESMRGLQTASALGFTTKEE